MLPVRPRPLPAISLVALSQKWRDVSPRTGFGRGALNGLPGGDPRWLFGPATFRGDPTGGKARAE